MTNHREPIKPGEMSLGQTHELVIALGKAGFTRADIQKAIEHPQLLRLTKQPAKRSDVLDTLGSVFFLDEHCSEESFGFGVEQEPVIAYCRATLEKCAQENHAHQANWCLMYLQGFSVVELCRMFYHSKKRPITVLGYEKVFEAVEDKFWSYKKPIGGYYLINFGRKQAMGRWGDLFAHTDTPCLSQSMLLEALLLVLGTRKDSLTEVEACYVGALVSASNSVIGMFVRKDTISLELMGHMGSPPMGCYLPRVFV